MLVTRDGMVSQGRHEPGPGNVQLAEVRARLTRFELRIGLDRQVRLVGPDREEEGCFDHGASREAQATASRIDAPAIRHAGRDEWSMGIPFSNPGGSASRRLGLPPIASNPGIAMREHRGGL